MRRSTSTLLAALTWSAACGFAQAQDTRTVREPAIAPACAVLLAEPAGAGHDDGPRIQGAIDKCAPGHALHLAADNENRGFVSGPLVLRSGVTLVVDAGATLYASTNPALFDRGAGTCGGNDKLGKGCRPLITADGTRGSGIMGAGTIDGQGGHLIDGKSESWWQIARRAQKEKTRQNVPRLIEVNRSQDFTMYGITLRNSPNFHVTLNQVDGFTAWGVTIDTPHDARNTDGIDPISSRNVTIAYSAIRTGDDNVAVKAGNNGPTEHVSILHNHFYSGHGMSIGSETNGGVRGVLVDDLSLDGTTSGLRIKSNDTRGGEVSGIVYRNVCLRGVKAPIDISTHYEPQPPGKLIPSYSGVRLEQVHAITGGRVILQGYDAAHPLQLAMRDVVIDGKPEVRMEFARITGADAAQPGQLNPPGAAGIDCSARFPAFPQKPEKDLHPQLTPEQASAYGYREVLSHVGPMGAERIDPWDPLADPLATGKRFTPDYTVDQHARADGKKRFNSVQAAVSQALADERGERRRYILVKPGVYHELVYVPASSAPITLYSDAADASATRIVATLDASVTGADYVQRFGRQFEHAHPAVKAMYESVKDQPVLQTQNATVVWVRAQGFQARNLTIENGYNKDSGDVREECTPATCPTPSDPKLINVHHQAVALRLDGADRAQFEQVRLLGFQDTLFTHSADDLNTVRSFFNKSYVEGDVDFIFGDTIAYFNDCEIRQLSDRSASYAAAPDTSRRARYGFVFNGCRFTSDGKPNTGSTRFYFARQWFHNQRCTPFGAVPIEGYSCKLGEVDVFRKPDGSIKPRTLERVGKMVVLNSRIGSHIRRDHPWSDWNRNGTLNYRPAQFGAEDYRANLAGAGLDPVRDIGEREWPAPSGIFLGEYNNTYE
jgi:pectin methylesterase-like acyl-CoA thioesterase